jgi:hypothetical protein
MSGVSVQEFSLEYGSLCHGYNRNCTVNIEIKKSFEVNFWGYQISAHASNSSFPHFQGNVYFYYGLDNYFQNHRRYVKSRSDKQLIGDLEVSPFFR